MLPGRALSAERGHSQVESRGQRGRRIGSLVQPTTLPTKSCLIINRPQQKRCLGGDTGAGTSHNHTFWGFLLRGDIDVHKQADLGQERKTELGWGAGGSGGLVPGAAEMFGVPAAMVLEKTTPRGS